MTQITKNELKSAYVFLKCSQNKHDDCRKIRDALLDRHPNVRRAQTVNVKIKGERWCVSATALVNSMDAASFEKELSNLCADGICVTDVHLIIDDQTDIN